MVGAALADTEGRRPQRQSALLKRIPSCGGSAARLSVGEGGLVMKRSAQQQGYDLAVMVARAALTDENVVIPREGVSTELLQTAIMALGEIVSAAFMRRPSMAW